MNSCTRIAPTSRLQLDVGVRHPRGWLTPRGESPNGADDGEADLFGDHVARWIHRGRGRQVRVGGARRGGARVRQRARAGRRHVSVRAPDVRDDGLLGEPDAPGRAAAGRAGVRGDLARAEKIVYSRTLNE